MKRLPSGVVFTKHENGAYTEALLLVLTRIFVLAGLKERKGDLETPSYKTNVSHESGQRYGKCQYHRYIPAFHVALFNLEIYPVKRRALLSRCYWHRAGREKAE